MVGFWPCLNPAIPFRPGARSTLELHHTYTDYQPAQPDVSAHSDSDQDVQAVLKMADIDPFDSAL